MKSMLTVRAAWRWIAGLLLACAAFGVGVAFSQVGAAPGGGAAAASSRSIDHLKTGFALTGSHVDARCESCHLNGIFKGTPRDCASCHQSGMRLARGNVVMPQQHVPTQQACETCHNTKTFVGAKFSHTGVAPSSCTTCHNGASASAKPRTHLPTSASCDTCHRTSGWVPAANFDHAGVVPGTCLTCHNGQRAPGKSAQHMPVSAAQSCDDCHKGFTAWRPTAWNHTQTVVTAQCSTCHTGGFPPADGRPSNHIPYASVAAAATANCDTCHKGSFSTWANGRFHASVSVTGSCASCHSGSYLNAVGKPSTPVHTGVTNCESCHTTNGWAGAQVNHSTFTAATNCASCHGVSASGKPSSHIPVAATNCFSCHSVAPAGWKPTKWTHTQLVVANACASCHNGNTPPADGKPTNHIPYQTVAVSAAANCDACHKGSTTTWANGRFHSSYSVSNGCANCHTLSAAGSYLNAVGKPNTATHASVTGNCESCHTSTASWSSASVSHAGFTAATNCASCHGVSASGKPSNHIPVAATNCFSCHNVAPARWTPTKWNHTQVTVTAACSSCHTGSYPPADGRPTNHIPYQAVAVTAAANCDGCHKGSYATWANGRLHTNYSISTGCSSCHTLTAGGTYLNAVGKPNTPTHSTVTGNCESCHRSTASWATVTFAHSAANAVGTGTCDTCHNGSTAKGKSATHIPIPAGAAKCDSCHRSQASFTTSVTMNHTVVTTGQCKSCHNGSYTSQGTQGALAKPSNHIPEVQLLNGAAMDCNACHTSTTAWTTMRMNHNSSMGNGAGSCKACHQSGTAYLGSMQKMSLTHRGGSAAGATDCSQSGCHRPLGNFGAAYTKWN